MLNQDHSFRSFKIFILRYHAQMILKAHSLSIFHELLLQQSIKILTSEPFFSDFKII